MRLKPIFDTNIFSLRNETQRREWQVLLHHRPSHGWPLSLVTVLELLAGLDGIPAEKFPALRAQVQRAYQLSRGRVLEDPMPMLCKEVLHIPFPARLVAPAASLLQRYMDVVRRAETLDQLLEGVPYKGLRAGLRTPSAVNDLVCNLKKQWVNALEELATARNPAWRDLFLNHGKRLPPEMRRNLESPSIWRTEGRTLIEQLLRGLLDTTPEQELIDVMVNKFSAVLEFSTFVSRAFLTGNYSIEKHSSDVFDQFQLRYLAMDRFVIVTGDPDLLKRTARSSQAARIMTIQHFLQTL